MATFLVLGGSGFIGGYLVRHLHARGISVVAVARAPGHDAAPGDQPSVTLDAYHQLDEVQALILHHRPSCIVDLTGGRHSISADHLLLAFRLARFLAGQRLETRLILAGSAAEYGRPVSLPVDESHPLRPLSEYGFIKAARSWMARAIHDECGLPVMVARIFNVVGPGQARDFLVGSVVAQAVDVLEGARRTVEVGNLEAARDFVDARDVVRALELVAASGRAGEAYNVCSGRPTTVREILRRVEELSALPPQCRTAPSAHQTEDVPVIYGSHSKITRDTGWVPEIALDLSIADMIRYETARRRHLPPGV